MNRIKTSSVPVAGAYRPSGNDLVPVKQENQLPVEYQDGENSEQHAQAILPNGQNISVVTNHNIHLPFREWLLRGLIGGVGQALAYPFRLVGDAIAGIVQGVIGIVKIAILVIIGPTLFWLGLQLLDQMKEQESVEDGTAYIVDQAGSFVDGVGRGISKDEGATGEMKPSNTEAEPTG